MTVDDRERVEVVDATSNVTQPSYDELATFRWLVDAVIRAEARALLDVHRPQRQPVIDVCREPFADEGARGRCGVTTVDGWCPTHGDPS